MSIMNKGRRGLHSAASLRLLFAILALLLVGVACLTVTFKVNGFAWKPLLFPSAESQDVLLSYTVWHIRMPRLLLAVSLGGTLAIAGCLLQAVTRNFLADPEIMGLNQGASCFAVIALMVFGGVNSADVILAAALCGAAASGVLIYFFSRFSGSDPSRLVLAGVAISAFMGALTTGIILLFETQLTEILYWMAGKLSGAEWRDNYLVWVLGVPAIIIAFLLSNTLNVLMQGEEIASGLGVHVKRIRGILGLLIIVLTGSAVAVAGPIGFIGLIVPHMAGRLGGVSYRVVIPLSALMGALLLAAADFAAQWLFYPADIPVGILTAILGVPFFLYLLRRSREGGRS
ncbi:iron ABC transporter permease [Paenibacillus pinisoli]|uniref:Iron ABC transporter permease n=1 Tax=Paenibacillus pinisoli TaxID=1276110 RepID=A0A3A6PJ31_9BACL|nr:iron ABC transporter permease [Paenibacillus pinisoli]RJX41205.1 iron ABC transporter permease [Paenibacillus pinisoli]